MHLHTTAYEELPFSPFFWIGISIILLVAYYFSGPFIQFPITYLIPIALVAWYNGRVLGLVLAFILPFVRLYFNIALWTIPWSVFEAIINCAIRIIVFSIFVVLIDRIAHQTRELSKEIKILSGLLPICSYCKKIKDESNKWYSIESYVSAHSDASFTHGICPECVENYFGKQIQKKDHYL